MPDHPLATCPKHRRQRFTSRFHSRKRRQCIARHFAPCLGAFSRRTDIPARPETSGSLFRRGKFSNNCRKAEYQSQIRPQLFLHGSIPPSVFPTSRSCSDSFFSSKICLSHSPTHGLVTLTEIDPVLLT